MKIKSLDNWGKDLEMNTTTSKNADTVKMLMRDWHLGPEVTAGSNKEFWISIGKAWSMSEKEARRRLCANCEYFNNTPNMLRQMESIPINKLDKDGGGRGYCHKFEFICHNLRTCQAWEEKKFYLED